MNEPTITIIGNLTKDPELKHTQQGTSYAQFTVAATPRTKRDDGWVDGTPIFWRCTAWDKLADNLTDSLTKGSRVIVIGRITRETWTKDGEDHEMLKITVEEIGPTLRFHRTKVSNGNRSGDGD